jgi:hypothetical protein
MSALSRIEKAGFTVYLDGDSLGISPAKDLTMPQREFLRSHKSEIIRELRAGQAVDDILQRLAVTCYTPNGTPTEAEARDQGHAAWLLKMNPKPQKDTHQ